jgi:nitroreductase
MDVIFKRRSVRKYTSQAVSDADIEAVIRAGMAAPSAGNQQPWHFLVIRDRSILLEIANINPYAKMLEHAPAAILVCGDMRLEKHEGFWVQDCSAATENMLIELTQRGLGGVWLGFYPVQSRVDGIKKLFNLPKEVTPLCVVALGHPAEKTEEADRFKKERIHFDAW